MGSVYNRFIDVQFLDKDRRILLSVTTPRVGRKPNITVSGSLSVAGIGQNISLRIANFYTNVSLTTSTIVRISLGYAGSESLHSFTGTLFNYYVVSEGVQRVSVFEISLSQADLWFSKTIDVHLKAEATYSDAFKEVASKLGSGSAFSATPAVKAVLSKPLGASLDFTGGVKDYISELSRRTGLSLLPVYASGRLAFLTEDAGSADETHAFRIRRLLSTPQYTGGAVFIECQYEPDIIPSSYVTFSSTYGRQRRILFQLAQVRAMDTVAQVYRVDFTFGTIQGNRSSIHALLVGYHEEA